MYFNLKQVVFPILFYILFGCEPFTRNRIIKIKGSETLQPLIAQLAEKYNQTQPTKIVFKIEGGGSQSGIDALLAKDVDIAMSSKTMADVDKDSSILQGEDIKRLEIAIDEILIVVNSGNKLSKITNKQLKQIYAGEITTWDKIGGTVDSIVPMSRKKGSGSLSYFQENIMLNQPFSASVRYFNHVNEILAKLETDENGIAFVGGSHFSKKIKVMDISKDGEEYFYPSERNVRAKYYPYVIPLSLYYVEDPEKEVLNRFLEFIVSKSARNSIIDMGFIPETLN